MRTSIAAVGVLLSSLCGCSSDDDDGGAPSEHKVAISELMYRPVLEESFEDLHEFIELHNWGQVDVDLAGFQLTGGIDFTFDTSVMLPAGEYLVVAKDAAALRSVAGYALDDVTVVGDYARTLDNGHDVVELSDDAMRLADRIEYDDGFPWPHAANAFGAGESWLSVEHTPLEAHRGRGHSLERVRSDLDGTTVANWVPSPLDAPTPGRPNTGAADVLPTILLAWNTRALGGSATIAEADEVLLTLTLGGESPAIGVSVEYFVEDVTREDEMRRVVAAVDDGTGPDVAEGDGQYSALLPPQAENSIVRFRVLLDVASEARPISPRPTDPYEWHAYFVDPGIATTSPVHHLFIDPGRWTQLWDNIEGGRVLGCEPSPTWNGRVPAVLVHGGVVYDVQVRYQGSRWNRTNGPALRGWSQAGPQRPNPPQALSWRIAFPRYRRLDDKKAISINKLTQACPGLTTSVGFALFDAAGMPTPQTRYTRLHINGGYYHYGLEIERPGTTMLKRYHEQVAEQQGRPAASVGHLFKSAGCNCDEGPYGWGDGRLLDENCGYSPYERYVYTYGRKTHEWASHDELIALIEGLHTARDAGTDALRSYLSEHFDVELSLSYLAVINWAAPFDDMFQNHFLYQRRDGRWMFTPWDLDNNFGGDLGPDASFYVGEQGDRDNRSGWWNYFKDSFFEAYRDEFTQRLRSLSDGPLHPDQVGAVVDEVAATMNIEEAEAAPAGTDCDFGRAAADFKDFASRRHAALDALH